MTNYDDWGNALSKRPKGITTYPELLFTVTHIMMAGLVTRLISVATVVGTSFVQVGFQTVYLEFHLRLLCCCDVGWIEKMKCCQTRATLAEINFPVKAHRRRMGTSN